MTENQKNIEAEDFKKFQIGSQAELPENIPQGNLPSPEWKSELPDMKLALDDTLVGPPQEGKQMGELDEQQRRALYEAARGHYESSAIEDIIDDVKWLGIAGDKCGPHTIKDKRGKDVVVEVGSKKELGEKLARSRERLLFEQLDIISQTQQEMLDFQSPFPYESKYPLGALTSTLKRIERELSLQGKEAKNIPNEEQKLVLQELREASLWVVSNYHVLEGLSSAMKAYYDGEYQMNQLYQQFRRITGTTWTTAFSKDLPGANLSEEEKAKLVEIGYLKEKETFREKAVKASNDNMFWTMAIASAGQYDYDNEKPDERPDSRAMKISEREREFINYLFGAGKDANCLNYDKNDWIPYKGGKIPQYIQNWFALKDETGNMQAHQTLMGILLEKRVRDSLVAISTDPDFTNKAKALANELKGEARKRLDKIYKEDDSADERLNTVTFDMGKILTTGLMASGDLGWGYKHHFKGKDDKGNEWEEGKETKIGGIYTAFDVSTVYFWLKHKVEYDENAETRSSLWLPSVGDFREMWEGKPPYWKNKLDLSQDKLLEKMYDALIKSSYKDILVRADQNQKYGVMDEKFVKFYEENVSAWVTPFPEKGTNDKWLAFPVAIPPVLDSINFFRSTRFKFGENKKYSFFEALAKRELEFNNLPWKDVRHQSFDYWRVNMAQMHKWYVLLVGTHELKPETQKYYESLLATPGGLFEKELNKRVRLGSRGEKEKRGVWNLAVIPMIIALSAAKDCGIIGRSQGETSDFLNYNSKMNEYWRKISSWIGSALDLPAKTGKDEETYAPLFKNYNGTMAFMIFYHAIILEKLSNASKDKYERDSNQTEIAIGAQRGGLKNLL